MSGQGARSNGIYLQAFVAHISPTKQLIAFDRTFYAFRRFEYGIKEDFNGGSLRNSVSLFLCSESFSITFVPLKYYSN